MISMLSLFECITRSLSMEEMKLFAIARQTFHVSHFFLRLFMMSFKYGLTLLRYSSTDSVLNCYSKNYLILLVSNNFLLLLSQKDSLYLISILSLIALVFFLV